MNDVLGTQLVALCKLGFPSLTPRQKAAFAQQVLTCSAMNSSVHAAATKQGLNVNNVYVFFFYRKAVDLPTNRLAGRRVISIGNANQERARNHPSES